MEGVVCSSWLLVVKCKKREVNWKTELLSKKRNQSLRIWKFFSLFILLKIRNFSACSCSKENTRSVVEWLFDKEIGMGVNHRPNQISQQWHCQFELKGIEMGQNEWSLFDFLGLQNRATELFTANICYSSRQRKNDPEGNSKIIRATSSVSNGVAIVSVSTGQTTFTESLWDGASQSLGGMTPTWHSCGGRTSAPVGPEGRVWSQREVFLSLKILWSSPC